MGTIKKYNFEKGSSTIELLIAFAVLITGLVASLSISVGNQSTAVDTQTDHEALGKAEELLENAKQNLKKIDVVIFMDNYDSDVNYLFSCLGVGCVEILKLNGLIRR